MATRTNPDLAPGQTRLGLRLFLIHGALHGAWYAVGMPANAIIAGFALRVLGMTREDAGLIGAFLYSAAVFQFLSFAVTNRVRDRKRFLIVVGAGEMLFLAGVLLTPLALRASRPAAHAAFFACLFLSGTCLHLAQPLLNSWLAALIPARMRGRYLGARQLLITGLHTLVAWLALRLLDCWESWAGFALVIGACCTAGVVGFALLRSAPMPRVSQESTFHVADVRGVLAYSPFRRYLAFIVLLFAGFSLACSYYTPFFLEEVGLTFKQVSWYFLAHNLLMLATLRPGGRLVDRIGARPVLLVMVAIYAAFFLAFPWFSRERYATILAAWALVGVADALYWVAVTSTLYNSLPSGPKRTGYLAIAQGVVMVSMGVGPWIVRVYLGLARDLHVTLFGLELERFRLMFAFCGLLFVFAFAAACRLENTRRLSNGQIVAALLRSRPFTLLPQFWKPRDSE